MNDFAKLAVGLLLALNVSVLLAFGVMYYLASALPERVDIEEIFNDQ